MDYVQLIDALESAPSDQPGRFEFTAGILLCGRIKRHIEMCNAAGMPLKAWCGRGWIERDWIVRGSVRDLRSFALWLGRL